MAIEVMRVRHGLGRGSRASTRAEDGWRGVESIAHKVIDRRAMVVDGEERMSSDTVIAMDELGIWMRQRWQRLRKDGQDRFEWREATFEYLLAKY
uniref:Uncharacterized protein n=1 Tax=Oryza sativa subsp. japonica TaxID=39947 RepID=Q94I22_ORYSJ|nr:Hypothetical protein [Oryza sativa Japonica Group]